MKKLFFILSFILIFNAFAEEQYPTSGNDCGDHCSWSLENGVLTITGYGDIKSYPRDCSNGCSSTAPWSGQMPNITKIVIENEANTEGFKNIGSHAFCDLRHVQEAVLPEGLEKIGEGAFLANYPLTKVNLPSSLTDIEGYAFDDTNLTNITIPSGITKIESCAFGNVNITSIIIPENVTAISPIAFTVSTGTSDTPLETIYCPEHLLTQCQAAVAFRTNAGLTTEILPYQKTQDGQIFYQGKWYATANDILIPNGHIKKRIYTIDEANKISKPNGNTIKIKYR